MMDEILDDREDELTKDESEGLRRRVSAWWRKRHKPTLGTADAKLTDAERQAQLRHDAAAVQALRLLEARRRNPWPRGPSE